MEINSSFDNSLRVIALTISDFIQFLDLFFI
jgi:hypothetical protein